MSDDQQVSAGCHSLGQSTGDPDHPAVRRVQEMRGDQVIGPLTGREDPEVRASGYCPASESRRGRHGIDLRDRSLSTQRARVKLSAVESRLLCQLAGDPTRVF